MQVALFVTCLTDQFYPRTGIAAVKVLEHLGCNVEFPLEQTCCGQPMYNNGLHPEAAALARRFVTIFEPFEAIVTPSGSCAAMVRRHYADLVQADPAWRDRVAAVSARTFEFVEFLDRVLKFNPAAAGVRWPGRATCHCACHLRELGLFDLPRHFLSSIPGLNLAPLAGAEQCCGFGGTFAVKYVDPSMAMVTDKVDALIASGATTLVCNDAGCAMNIEGACRRRGVKVDMRSIAEILAEGLGLLPRENNG